MVLLMGAAHPAQRRAAHPGMPGWMEKVLGALSKARPGEGLQELGGGSGSCSLPHPAGLARGWTEGEHAAV